LPNELVSTREKEKKNLNNFQKLAATLPGVSINSISYLSQNYND
jgi:carbon monoxide dehydrogenase subunit G